MVWLKEIQRKIQLLGKYLKRGDVDKYHNSPEAVKQFYRVLREDYITNEGQGIDKELMQEDYEQLMEVIKEIEEKKSGAKE